MSVRNFGAQGPVRSRKNKLTTQPERRQQQRRSFFETLEDRSLMATISYAVPAATAGTQNFGGSLGMDFNVTSPITVTNLGAFDSNSDGISGTINVRLYDRTAPGAPLATASFTGTTDQLFGGSRFSPIAALNLPAGFQGRIVADGYNGAELNGNSLTPTWTTNSGGALTFVGGGFYDLAAGMYPATPDGGPANRYAAGTFTFVPQSLTTTYADDSWGALAAGTLIQDADPGTAGDQNAVFGVDAFATIGGAVAAAAANGSTVVSAGSYAETVTLSGTKTLEISAPAEAVTLNALNTAAGQSVVLEGTAVLTLGDATNSTIAGIISGSGSLVKEGAGTLLLSAQNTFTGGTTVNTGTLLLGTGGAVGAIRGTVTVNAGATLDNTVANTFGFNAGQSVNVLNINGGTVGGANFGQHFWNSFVLNMTGGTLHLGGTLNEFHNPTITVNAAATSAQILGVTGSAVFRMRDNTSPLFDVADGAAANDLVLSVPLTQNGGSNITKAGAGQMRYDAASSGFNNVFVSGGSLTIGGSGTHAIGGILPGAAIGDGARATGNGTLNIQDTVVINSSSLSVNNQSSTIGTVNQSGGTLNVSGLGRIGHWPGGTGTYNLSSGALNLTGTPSGVVNLAGTPEQNGILYLGVDGAGVFNQTGGAVTAQGVVLDGRGNTGGVDTLTLNGGSMTLGASGIKSGSLDTNTSYQINLGGGTLLASADWSSVLNAALTNAGGPAIFDTNTFAITMSGVLSGSSLVKQGAGTLLLSGQNTLNGSVTVNAGTLNLQTGSLAGVNINPLGTSALTVNNTGNVVVSQGASPMNGPGSNLAMSWYQTGAATAMITNIGNNTATGGLLGAVPTGSKLLAGAINFGNDGAFQGSTVAPIAGAPLTAGDNYMFLYRGFFTPAVTGTYQFGVGNQAAGSNIDDEAAVYIDLNGDNLYNTAAATTERVAYRATAGGSDAGAGVALTAGVAYPIAIAFREATGGAIMIANVQRTAGAPTTTWANINSATGSGVGTFTAYGAPVGNTFANNVVNISGTANIEIQVPGTAFGTLNAAAGSTLNLNGTGTGANNSVTFASAVLAGAATINTNTASGFITGVVSQTVADVVTKGGTNLLTFAGANTYAGTTAITAGTFRVGNQNALGTIAGGTTISAGATLDINGFRVGPDGNEPISVEGTGVGGIGAIVNTRTAATLAVIRNLTLTNNATLSSQFRWDIRDDGGDPVTFDMNGFTLTKIGGAELCIVNGVVVDPGSVNVNTGIFRLEGSTDFDGTGTISVAGGATLDFWQNTQSFAVNIALANTANLTTNDGAGAGPTLTGTITLNGQANFNLEKDSTFSGQITGTGGFNKNTGTGVLTLTNNTNNYAGSTAVNAGTLVATQPNSLGTTAGNTTVAAGATLRYDATAGALTPAAEPLILAGTGVGNAGALQSVGNDVTLTGPIVLTGDTFFGSNTAARTLRVDGPVTKALNANLTLQGAGNFDINGSIGDGGFSLSPITARVFNGVNQDIANATIITDDINGTTVATRTNSLNGPLTLPNLAAFNALFTPAIPLADTFTTVFETTLTVTTGGTYTFAVTNNDDGAIAWLKPAANASFVTADRLYAAITGNNNTAVATRVLTPGTYTLVYAHREGAGGEAFTARLAGPGMTGFTDGTLLPIVNPVPLTNHLVKTGAGSAELSGNNSYTGVTLVHQGALTVDANNALGASAPTSAAVPVGALNQHWQVGVDNNTNTDFSQESGTSNAAPGSATARDDDWYFAGTYPAPIGTLGANEALAGGPATGFERALTIGDPTDRIHFNLTPDQLDDNFNLVIDTNGSSLAGNVNFQVLVNGVSVHTQTVTADGLITTATFNGAAVNAITGDNVVTLTRTGGTGPWLQFDYIRLNRQPVVSASNTQLEAGTSLTITGGITSNESLVLNGVTGVFAPAGANTVTGTVQMLANTTYDIAAGASLALTGAVSGAADLSKAGSGTLILAGTNTYTGATNVNVGTLTLQNGAAVLDTAGLVTVANGATLQLDASETVSSYDASGTSTLVLAANTLTVNTGDAPLGNVTSSGGGVVAVAGSIVDANAAAMNVTGTSIYLQAATGIGTGADPIETAVGSIQLNNVTSGVVNVLNSNAGALLTVADLRTLGFGARNLGGALTVVNSSPMTIAANVIAAGAIVLTATDSAAVGDDLTVNAGVTIQSTGSTVTLNAGDIANVPATALVAAAGNVVINIDAGDADAGVGGALNFAADVDAPLAIFNGLSDANGDTFNVRPDQDVGDVLTPIQVFGLAPTANPNGDALVLNITGLGIPTLTLGPGDRNGSFSFGALAAPLTYNNIENVSTNPALPYHLVLDMRFSGYENGAADTILAQLDAAGTNLLLDVNAANVFTGPDAVIQSLTIIGSNDNDALTIQQTAGGLPRFLGAAPVVNNTGVGGSTSNGSHLNSSADLALETLIPAGTPWDAADVTMHFDGGAGTDSLAVNYTTANSTGYFSDALDAGNSGNLSTSPGVFPALGTPTLLMSFANIEPLTLAGAGGLLLTDATGTAATTSLTLTDIGAQTQIVGNGGFAPTTFSGFNAAVVVGGGGAETLDVVSLDNATLTSVTLYGGNTNDLLTLPGGDASADTLRVRSLPATIAATLNGNGGSDLFQLFDGTSTIDNIAGIVTVDGTDGNVGGNTDTLTIVNTGGATADNAIIGAVNAGASADYFVDGITPAVGSDVIFRNIDVLNYTGTTLADTIDGRFVNTTPAHDLSTVNLSGWTGADQFLLFISDQVGGSGLNNTPSGVASGVANINLYGDAPGNPNAGDGNDTFGATPAGIVGTGATNVGLVVSNTTRMIRPSVTTSIAIDGGQPTGLAAPLGDVIGDVNNVDISALPNSAAVIVSTFSPGTVVAAGIQPLTWTQIEDINLVDQGKLTNVQMGDLFARTTPNADLVQISRNPTALNPNQVRLRITATIGNYSASNKTIIYGGGMNDTITQSNLTIPAEFYGEAGDDYLAGAMNNDWLVGGDGNDRINGSGGDNVIWGDNAPTNPGDLTPQDSATGGDDQLSGLGGNDVFYGSGGNDQVSAGGGNDYVNGGAGNDTLGGDDGDDRVYGGAGNDVMGGGFGNDLLSGGDGSDQLYGNGGNDVIFGGTAADSLDGGEGNDLLVSGSVANENSTWTSVASTTTYSAATYTSGADNDAALLTLLSQWGSASNRSSIAGITHDGANDDLAGYTGDDDFCWETADVLDNFPGTSPNDFNAPSMGTDERFGPT